MEGLREEVAKNLHFYRKKSGLTQKELGNQLGVKNTAISNWEKGVSSIDIDTLHVVCILFDVSVNDMFGKFANISRKLDFSRTEQTLLENFRELNEEGQHLISSQANALVLSGIYKKHDVHGLDQQKQA